MTKIDKEVVMDIDKFIDPEMKTAFQGLSINQEFIERVKRCEPLDEIRKAIYIETAPVNIKDVEKQKICKKDYFIPQLIDGTEIRVRAYTPVDFPSTTVLPAILFIHGGGFTLGNIERTDSLCCYMSVTTNCIVLSVEYRLSPEYVFPVAIEDCYSALLWLVENAHELRVDSSRIAVCGPSAGGCLAASVTLMARDRDGPRLGYQCLIYPILDDRHQSLSSHSVTHPKVWNRELSQAAWRAYLGKDHSGEVSPYAAPARAEYLAELPPAYILVADLDLLRDEAVKYAVRLTESGVPTELHMFPRVIHGFDFFCPGAEVSKRATAEYMGALKRALHNELL